MTKIDETKDNPGNIEEIITSALDELTKTCLDLNVPFFATVGYESNSKTKYINRAVTPIELGVNLTDDKITKYAASLNESFVLKIKSQENNTVSGDMFGDIVEQDY